MGENDSVRTSRRGLLKRAAGGAAMGLGAAMLGGCGSPAGDGGGGSGSQKRLKALISNAGLQGSWNARGRDAVMLWADKLNVDVTWVDGEFNGGKQREKIDLQVDNDWDFFAAQAHQIDILEEPVRKLKKRNIPVISMDTLIVEKPRLREAGVWLYIAPDHFAMAQQSTRYLVEKIGGRGNLIHIGGQSEHSGAQQRKRGFESVIAEYGDDIKVLGGEVRWCDWKIEKARTAFDALLAKSGGSVAGAFFHNDDMAMACATARKGPYKDMVFTAVDGQTAGQEGIRSGALAATVVNPAAMIHGWSLIIGQFIVRNQEKIEDVPLEITVPSPLVTKEAGNVDAVAYLGSAEHCLM
ncbi:MAG: sugar ABC transporter substrate-binding protein [Candidatus Nealsonbacteria bacterium]|nr:sugar ABC transporter substrate-binding protein [Candidatus Nealsonbacteria bacterium]